MSKRVTILDIAKAANVSHTAVYKALNNKPYVREETKRRILETAEEMGYRANKLAQSMVRKSIRIGLILEGYYSDFSNDLVRGVKDGLEALLDYKVEGVFAEFDASHSREKTIERVRALKTDGVDGIIFSPYTACLEYVEMIDWLDGEGIPVILVTADIPGSNRITVVRQNGRLVGEIGAELLDLFRAGEHSAVFVGNKCVVHHQEIIDGFEEKIRGLGHEMTAVYETQDDDMIAYYSTERLTRDHPEVTGIFIGTSHSIGVCRKIAELGLERKITIIGTDIFRELTEFIESGTVSATIYQNSYMQGRLAVDELFKYLTEHRVTEQNIFVKPDILIKSNYKLYISDEPN